MNVDTREQLQMIHQRLKELFGLYRNAVNNKEISDNEFWILCSLLDMDGEVSQHDISSLWWAWRLIRWSGWAWWVHSWAWRINMMTG